MTLPSHDRAHVRGLEERAFNAWPALQTLVVDGWLIRFADGYTKRANSINAWTPETPIDRLLAVAAPLFDARGLPLIVRLSPLAGEVADATLAERGMVRIDETVVMTAETTPMAAPDADVAIDRFPAAAWSVAHAAANGVPDARRAIHDRMLALIAPPAAFATLSEKGRPLAWGLAVAERGMIGLFDIVVSPDARRRGAGRRLVGALAHWGLLQGAGAAYLQVVASNGPAIALYRRLGFTDAYRYHYRIGGNSR